MKIGHFDYPTYDSVITHVQSLNPFVPSAQQMGRWQTV